MCRINSFSNSEHFQNMVKYANIQVDGNAFILLHIYIYWILYYIDIKQRKAPNLHICEAGTSEYLVDK